MGFAQTVDAQGNPVHRPGKGSYHQIGLVRGQFGDVPEAKWVKFIADAGFDGWEEASWELDLRRCDTDAGAAAYAKERVDLAKKHGLEIFTVATHLQGQVLGRRAERQDAQLLLRQGRGDGRVQGVAQGGQQPAADRPVLRAGRGRQAHPRGGGEGPAWRASATPGTCRSCRTARSRCPGSSAARRTAGATGSCSRRCRASMEGYDIPDVRQVSLELLVERFGPVLERCASSTA